MPTQEQRRQSRIARAERRRREKEEEYRIEPTPEEIKPRRPHVGGPERTAEFDRQHNSDGIRVDDQIVYSDGASSDLNPVGRLSEPPTNEFERLTLQARYWESLVDDAVEEFDAEKQEIALVQKHSRHGPDDPEAEMAKLKRLQKIVLARRERLAEIQEQLEATEEWQRRQNREAPAGRGSASDFWEKVNSIEV